ncbi:hypothetical protein SK128_003066 [Halocaridina rubra]|uniref:Carbohydrate sulfotransferase n=1 Tax=Halocaridina rubra TaxID=373956 RepID=A0AAN8WKN9_HALRR
MNSEEFVEIMRSAEVTKLLSVRDPISRLVSAYINRFANGRYEVPSNASYSFMRKALKVEGKSLRWREPAQVNFTQFLNLILNEKRKNVAKMNYHWRPQSMTCDTCSLPYDHIIHLETMSDDLHYLIQKLGIHELKENLRVNSSHQKKINYEDYFREVPLDVTRQIVDLYRDDFALFGYDVPLFLRKLLNESGVIA